MNVNEINRAVAELRFNLDSPRWPTPHAVVQYAELNTTPWIDLCWWNGRAWQYITTRNGQLNN